MSAQPLPSPEVSRQEYAYQQIRARIMDGSCGPGARLNISDFAQRFGTSPIPVREALRRLEAEGLVDYTRNSGAIVKRPSDQDYVDVMSVLSLIDGEANALAGPHIGRNELRALRKINAAMQDALEQVDPMRFAGLNREFHFAIYASCPNRFLVEMANLAWARFDNLRHTPGALLPGRGPSAVAEHQELIEAFEAGTPARRLEQLGRQHRFKTLKAYQQWAAKKAAI